MNFKKLDKLVDVRSKLASRGSYTDYGVWSKTDIAIHHSLTKYGDAYSFARYHTGKAHLWPGIGYHFVILKDGTIQWCHDLGIKSYHVGNSNKFAVGICVVGDFRSEKPTNAQKESLKNLHDALKKDMPAYERTRGHSEFPGYSWKACPVFDYKAVINSKKEYTDDEGLYTVQRGDTFWGIAKDQGISADELKRANPDLHPLRLPIGEKINLPMDNGVKLSSESRPKGNTDTDSIVAYLNSIGMDSSFDHRAELAKQYGISGYKGTASQNTELLEKVRGGDKSNPSLPNKVLRRGDKGKDVEKLQKALNEVYFKCAVDGSFGPETEDALKRFQSVYDPHQVDGVFGPDSRRLLLEQLKSQ